MVYNQNFEYSEIQKLAGMFPKYQEALNRICDHIFDLKDLVKTSGTLFMGLGFSEKESKKLIITILN